MYVTRKITPKLNSKFKFEIQNEITMTKNKWTASNKTETFYIYNSDEYAYMLLKTILFQRMLAKYAKMLKTEILALIARQERANKDNANLLSFPKLIFLILKFSNKNICTPT